jgi:NAD+ synthase (glutamine-hydrolysing)
MIALNGIILAQGSQFSLSDVEVITATIDLEAVRAHRTGSSRRMQSAASEAYQRVRLDMRLDGGKHIRVGEDETRVGDQEIRYHTPEEEIA